MAPSSLSALPATARPLDTSNELADWLREHRGCPCPHCGEPLEAEIFEAWSCHEWSFSTCCERLQEEILAEMQDPDARLPLARALGAEDMLGNGGELRGVADDMGHLYLDWKLKLVPLEAPGSQAMAAAFIRANHRHCPSAPAGWLFGIGCYNGRSLIGIAWVGRPTARALDDSITAEVQRLCADGGVAPDLAKHACSMLYGASARAAKARGYRLIQSYIIDEEEGVTLRAAGWKLIGEGRGGGSWDTPSRRRESYDGPAGGKELWGIELQTAVQAIRQRERCIRQARNTGRKPPAPIRLEKIDPALLPERIRLEMTGRQKAAWDYSSGPAG